MYKAIKHKQNSVTLQTDHKKLCASISVYYEYGRPSEFKPFIIYRSAIASVS